MIGCPSCMTDDGDDSKFRIPCAVCVPLSDTFDTVMTQLHSPCRLRLIGQKFSEVILPTKYGKKNSLIKGK